MLPLAHAADWTWTLFVPPFAIVLAAIVRSVLAEHRRSGGKGR